MIIVIIGLILSIFILLIGMNIKTSDIKKVKKIAYDSKLNEITNKLPNNIEICKGILTILNNDNVKIEESNDKKSKTSLYLVIQNKIIVANISDTFTRVQTIAHECIHSVQDKKTLKFNFFYSNIYMLYGIVALLIVLFKIIKVKEMLTIMLFIYIILGLIYYIIRNFLELDAMIKAKYLAQDYMKKSDKLTNKEIDIVINNYDNINNLGIRLYSFTLAFECIIRILILAIAIIISNGLI